MENKYYPDYVPPPGSILVEILEERELSKVKFAEKLKKTEEELNELLEGKIALTKEISIALQEALDTPSHFWLNWEKFYREKNPLPKNIEKAEEYHNKAESPHG